MNSYLQTICYMKKKLFLHPLFSANWQFVFRQKVQFLDNTLTKLMPKLILRIYRSSGTGLQKKALCIIL